MGAKYRVAIIGTGRMGGLMEDEFPPGSQFHKPYGHFSAYQSIEETEVVAVANRGEERLKRFERRFGITNTYLDYREMIETEKPDIVSVTTPSVHRAEPIIFCAEHGVRGIYSEKGLCASLAEADRIREAVTANNVAFNWGAMRRHHDGYKQLRAAIADGAIGDLLYGIMYSRTDIIKHHPHTLDLVAMMLGDPTPVWVEGRLAEPGEGDTPGSKPYPEYDAAGHRYLPPAGEELADPIVGFFRVGYADGTEGIFVPRPGSFDVDVHGTGGRAYAWDNGEEFIVRAATKGGSGVSTQVLRPEGESPTASTIRNIIQELETGQRTSGNIDVTMQSVEVQFGIAHSHLQGGARVNLPVADRSLYIPGG